MLAKEYHWLTYGEVDKRRRHVGSALELKHKSGLYRAGEEFETVGIWSINRPGEVPEAHSRWNVLQLTHFYVLEWQIIDLACQAYKKVSVSLYDTFGPDACGKSEKALWGNQESQAVSDTETLAVRRIHHQPRGDPHHLRHPTTSLHPAVSSPQNAHSQDHRVH